MRPMTLARPIIEGTFAGRGPVVTQWRPAAIVLLFVLRGLATFVATYGEAMFAKLLAASAP
jgi:hypothetical protein